MKEKRWNWSVIYAAELGLVDPRPDELVPYERRARRQSSAAVISLPSALTPDVSQNHRCAPA
jgi:hypothetical protein